MAAPYAKKFDGFEGVLQAALCENSLREVQDRIFALLALLNGKEDSLHCKAIVAELLCMNPQDFIDFGHHVKNVLSDPQRGWPAIELPPLLKELLDKYLQEKTPHLEKMLQKLGVSSVSAATVVPPRSSVVDSSVFGLPVPPVPPRSLTSDRDFSGKVFFSTKKS